MGKASSISGLMLQLLSVFAVYELWCARRVKSLPIKCAAEYEKIVHIEGEMVDFCKMIMKEETALYVDETTFNFSRVLRFLEEAQEHDRYILDNERKIIDNPLAMYKLKRWLHVKWIPLLKHMSNSIVISQRQVFQKLLEEYKKRMLDLNVNAAVKDVADLIYIYDLPVHSVSMGTFGTAQIEPLEKDDIFQFIESLNDIGYHRMALLWLKTAFLHLSLEEGSRLFYTNLLASTYLKLRKYEEAKSIYKDILRQDENNRAAKSNIKLLEQSENNSTNLDHVAEYDDYVKKIKTFCHPPLQLSASKHAFLQCMEVNILNDTIRIDILHRNPEVYLIYDVFGEHRRRVLIEKASARLRSLLNSRFAAHQVKHQGSKVYFKNNWWIEPYTIRIRNITYNRHMDFDEHPTFQSWTSVVNYAAGMRHRMIRNQKTLRHKDLIAHYYIFLQAPECGGELVFPELKLQIKPVEGAAVFWQFRTKHTAMHRKFIQRIYCPVLIGSQWNAKLSVSHYSIGDWVTF